MIHIQISPKSADGFIQLSQASDPSKDGMIDVSLQEEDASEWHLRVSYEKLFNALFTLV